MKKINEEVRKMSCCDPSEYSEKDINGVCPECGEGTVDGDTYECCGYSPLLCKVCGFAPCDESC